MVRGEVYLEKKKEEMKGVKASWVSCFIKDIDYSGVSKRKGKRKKKKEKRNSRKIVHSMLVLSVKMS